MTVTGTRRLTETEIAGYYEHGFLPPFDLVARDEALALGRLVEASNRSLVGRLLRREPDASRIPGLIDLCRRHELLDRVEDLLGPNLVLWRTRLFVKTPAQHRYPFHQDGAFWRLENTATSPP